jgi:hypothetical protein
VLDAGRVSLSRTGKNVLLTLPPLGPLIGATNLFSADYHQKPNQDIRAI